MELLVVIGIIALLVGILLPALNRAREEANLIKCQANLRGIGQAIQIYVDFYKGILPEGQFDNQYNINTGKVNFNFAAQGSFGPGTDWTVLLESVMTSGAGSTWGTEVNGNFGQGAAFAKTRLVFTCPDAPQESMQNTQNRHYACNPRLMPQLGRIDPYFTGPGLFSPSTTCYHSYYMAKIKQTSQIALVFDGSLMPIPGGGGWSVAGTGTEPIGYNVDYNAIGYYYPGFAPYMTDQYGMTGNTPASPSVLTPISLNDPISMDPVVVSGETAAGNFPFINTDTVNNIANIRFRHLGNKAVNVLMCDGSVQTFDFDVKIYTAWHNAGYPAPAPLYTNLLRKNLYVTAPTYH